MPAQTPTRRLIFRWTTLKGLAAIMLFLIIVTLIEYFIVLYAINLGVKDETLLRWDFQFPGTDWAITITVSPLFHLIPTAVIITLVSSWTYLSKYIAVKPQKRWKGKGRPFDRRPKKAGKLTSKISDTVKSFFGKIKSGLLRIKGVAYLWQRIHFARATIKSALLVLLVFAIFALIFSLLAYPQLIYRAISNTYQSNPWFLGFVKSTNNLARGFAEALAPIGWVCSSINNALLTSAPGFRELALSFGSLIKPLADLDNAGKYLVFQNIAAWVSALAALGYGQYMRKSYGYGRK